MALLKEVTTLVVNGTGSNHAGDYILIYGVSLNVASNPSFSEKNYYIWWDTGSSSDPSISGATAIKVDIGASDATTLVASKTATAVTAVSDFVSTSNGTGITITNTYVGNVTPSNIGTSNAISLTNTTAGTGSFISNLNYPENNAMYFIEGDKLAILSKVNSSGNRNTTARKSLKSIQEDLVEGLMIQYYAEPNSVTAITDSLDIDNALELSVVDYVKKCLYMDKAGKSADPNVMQTSMAMANKHERNFKDAIQRYGVRKRDKTGGSRVVKVPNLI